MKKYLEMNRRNIIRKDDKMIFSANDMKIYKFNDAGFDIALFIAESDGIEKEKLYDIFSKSYSNQEIDIIINKMLDNKIILIKEKK